MDRGGGARQGFVMPPLFDHLAVAAASLEDGVAWVHAALGVAPSGGGAHPRMGTHNRLLRIGAGRYLEVIAPDPAAPPPGRRRWFALDTPPPQPRLAGWVVRCADIDRVAAQSPLPLGPVEPATRGSLAWRITIPEDGRPVAGGALPALIEWPAGVNPADSLPETGIELVGLSIAHPEPTRIDAVLHAIGWRGEGGLVRVVEGERPALVAAFATPRGPCRLPPA
jgi:hypothetical protein